MSDKLDHETESVIEEFAVEEWLSGKKMTNHASDARDALRQRIRVLVKEARKEGQSDPFPLVTAMERELDAGGDHHSETSNV